MHTRFSLLLSVLLLGSTACEPEGQDSQVEAELDAVADPFAEAAIALEDIPVPPAPAELDELDEAPAWQGPTDVSATLVDGNALAWTGWTSEEYPPLTCGSGQVARGFQCNGSYCDNIRMDCAAGVAGTTYGSKYWTGYFSEESTSYRYCGRGGWVSGIACNGSYCDNISLQCTNTNRGHYNCTWSGWFSEEDPAFVAPTGQYIKGVQCGGSYCDNKRYYYCSM